MPGPRRADVGPGVGALVVGLRAVAPGVDVAAAGVDRLEVAALDGDVGAQLGEGLPVVAEQHVLRAAQPDPVVHLPHGLLVGQSALVAAGDREVDVPGDDRAVVVGAEGAGADRLRPEVEVAGRIHPAPVGGCVQRDDGAVEQRVEGGVRGARVPPDPAEVAGIALPRVVTTGEVGEGAAQVEVVTLHVQRADPGWQPTGVVDDAGRGARVGGPRLGVEDHESRSRGAVGVEEVAPDREATIGEHRQRLDLVVQHRAEGLDELPGPDVEGREVGLVHPACSGGVLLDPAEVATDVDPAVPLREGRDLGVLDAGAGGAQTRHAPDGRQRTAGGHGGIGARGRARVRDGREVGGQHPGPQVDLGEGPRVAGGAAAGPDVGGGVGAAPCPGAVHEPARPATAVVHAGLDPRLGGAAPEAVGSSSRSRGAPDPPGPHALVRVEDPAPLLPGRGDPEAGLLPLAAAGVQRPPQPDAVREVADGPSVEQAGDGRDGELARGEGRLAGHVLTDRVGRPHPLVRGGPSFPAPSHENPATSVRLLVAVEALRLGHRRCPQPVAAAGGCRGVLLDLIAGAGCGAEAEPVGGDALRGPRRRGRLEGNGEQCAEQRREQSKEQREPGRGGARVHVTGPSTDEGAQHRGSGATSWSLTTQCPSWFGVRVKVWAARGVGLGGSGVPSAAR